MSQGKLLYALFMAAALGTALLLRRRSTLPPLQRWGVAIAAIFGAGVGAKLPFVLLAGESFLSLPAWTADGKTILSGLVGGYAAVEVAKLLLGISAKTGDGFAVPLAAAVAVGRWGCFFNGCCSAPGLPVPLLESAFHAGMAVLLWRLEGVERFRWQLLKLYLIAYGLFRFLVEFVRTEPRVAWGLTAYQLGALALAALMSGLWWLDDLRKRREQALAPVL
jgi:prolipoprotein diacylglyceryltransferase